MKKFLMAAAAAMLATHTSAALAAPDSPFFVGAFLGDSTLDVRGWSRIEQEPTVPKTYTLETPDSQTFSFLVAGGFRFTDHIGIEGQYATSLQDDTMFGGVKINDLEKSPMTSSVSAMGVYAVFQGGEDAYFKARVGIAQSEANFETDFASASYSTPGLSLGVSIGQKLGSLGSVELTFMRYPDVKVSQTDFAKNFASTAPFESFTRVRRDVGLEMLMFGYVFQF